MVYHGYHLYVSGPLCAALYFNRKLSVDHVIFPPTRTPVAPSTLASPSAVQCPREVRRSGEMAKPFVDGVGDDIREAYEDVRSDESDTNW